MNSGSAMPRRLPSLNALKAFEAAARHESFTRAADELCVTQGAVSHQVKALEAELGFRLFHRERQRLVITEAGRSYLEVVRDAFDRLAAGTERLLQRQSAGVLTVTTSPNFAAKWLVHRLGRFAEVHPSIDLRVSASLHHVDFAREDVDVAVRHGDGSWSGLQVTRLCTEALFPVCSPKLLRGRHALRGPAALRHHVLLHLDDRRDWAKWLEAAGVDGADLARGPVFNRRAWRSMRRLTVRAWRSRAPRSPLGISSPAASYACRSAPPCRCPTPIGSFARERRPICRRSPLSEIGWWVRQRRMRDGSERSGCHLNAFRRWAPHRSRRALLPHLASASGHDLEPPGGVGVP